MWPEKASPKVGLGCDGPAAAAPAATDEDDEPDPELEVIAMAAGRMMFGSAFGQSPQGASVFTTSPDGVEVVAAAADDAVVAAVVVTAAATAADGAIAAGGGSGGEKSWASASASLALVHIG